MVELPTFINKVVYFITNFKYNHFSISFDDNLDTLYSFQIKNANTILVGGFLKEKEAYYFRENKNLKLNEFVYEIPVSDIEYDKIRTEFLNGLGYKVIRFWNNDIYENINSVLLRLNQEINPHQEI